MNAYASRGVHHKFHPGTAAFKQGQEQGKISVERYHILCAALQNKYTTHDAPRNAHGGYLPSHGFDEASNRHNIDLTTLDPWTRKTIDFTPYKDFPLKPLPGIKLHPNEDGSIHPGDLQAYCDVFEDNWKTQEGGVLYCVAEYREFFNCLLNYKSPAKTTGMKAWDELFQNLESTGYPKSIIPCMFFGREAGCMHSSCPFLHDKNAVLQNRDRVLTKRRETMDGKPTARQIMSRQRLILEVEAGENYDRRRVLAQSTWLERAVAGDRAYCANQMCLKPWKQVEETCPLKRCQKCKFTFYCSLECQKKDWKRHKREPCAPIEQLINDDDLWSPAGTRKGTEMIEVNWGG